MPTYSADSQPAVGLQGRTTTFPVLHVVWELPWFWTLNSVRLSLGALALAVSPPPPPSRQRPAAAGAPLLQDNPPNTKGSAKALE